MRAFLLIPTLIFMGLFAQAYQYRCVEHFEGSVASLCLGRTLPSSKTRNFHSESQQIVCTPGVDHYIRLPQKYDFEKWNDLLKTDQEQEAQNMRKSQSDIAWTGTIPYQTVETWTWESCDLVTDSFACGTHTGTRTVTKIRTKCSGSGEKSQCHDEPYQATESYQAPNTCWSDIARNEDYPCTNEQMSYTARYARPDYNQWKPGQAGYIDAIPNKYDLLPGEIEDVQIFSNSSSKSTLSPVTEVGDAWNIYQLNDIRGSGVGAQCRQNSNLHIDVVITPLNRQKNKKTPNAFKLPTDMQGLMIDPIIWNAAQDTSGNMIQKGTPVKIRLADTSSGIINSISEQSRKTAEREQMKQQQGKGITKDALTPADQMKSGFFKNTKVRIQLLKKNNFLFDTATTKKVIFDQGQSIVPTTNVFSEDQEVAFSDMWEIDLKGNDNGVYAKKWGGSERNLKPGQNYYFDVSVYQKGAKGLYLQDCDEDPTFWSCHFRWMGLGKSDNNIFSEPLKIPFSTNESMKDHRGRFEKLMDVLK